jgi:hypothetical protein
VTEPQREKRQRPMGLRDAQPLPKTVREFSDLKPAKKPERTEARQKTAKAATELALSGLAMTGTAIEDPVIERTLERVKPVRVRQREERIRREAAVHAEQVAASTPTKAEATEEVDDFDPELQAALEAQEELETDQWIAQNIAERRAAGEDVPEFVPGGDLDWTNFEWGDDGEEEPNYGYGEVA